MVHLKRSQVVRWRDVCLTNSLRLKCERKLLPLCLSFMFHFCVGGLMHSNLQKCKNIQLITKGYEKKNNNNTWKTNKSMLINQYQKIKKLKMLRDCQQQTASSGHNMLHLTETSNKHHKPMSAGHIWELMCAAALP